MEFCQCKNVCNKIYSTILRSKLLKFKTNNNKKYITGICIQNGIEWYKYHNIKNTFEEFLFRNSKNNLRAIKIRLSSTYKFDCRLSNVSPKADAIVSCITDKFDELNIETAKLKAFLKTSVITGSKDRVATKLKQVFVKQWSKFAVYTIGWC